MPLVVTLEVANSTTKQYDEVLRRWTWAAGQPHSGSFMCAPRMAKAGYSSAIPGNRLRRSRSSRTTRSVRCLRAAGVTERPKITVRPVHNFLER